MDFTRREFGKLTLASLPALALYDSTLLATASARARPNSLINGVQIGTITYSYRQMPDQSAEATLRYIVESGISAVELMGGPVETFAGAPSGRSGGAGGRGPGSGAPARGAGGGRGTGGGGRGNADPSAPPILPEGATMGSWGATNCVIPAPARGNNAGGSGARGGGRAGGAAPTLTAEQQAARAQQQAAQQEAQNALKNWRTSVSMDVFKRLRRMYNDAGVSIYAWKQLSLNMSDEEYEYIFDVAEALGCTHTTLELPSGPDAPAQLKRLGDFAMKKKVYAAYHSHTQGSMTAFDQAFAASKGNMANVDLGHYVAGGNVGGSTLQFLEKYHGRVSSVHLKDRTTPPHCALNLPWGTGETPIKDILQLMRKNTWKFPASIELEYNVPADSDPVTEVRKCFEYCKAALA